MHFNWTQDPADFEIWFDKMYMLLQENSVFKLEIIVTRPFTSWKFCTKLDRRVVLIQ